MSVTINDVARKAKVSKAAVSYVINNKPGVSEATRRRVLQVMAELDYRPNPNARGLAGQSTGMIGMAIPDISDMFYARIIRGVEKEVNTHDFILNLCTTHGLAAREEEIVNILGHGRVDGLLLMAYTLKEAQLEELLSRGLPFVLVNCPPERYHKAYPSIYIDHYHGAVLGTEHLIEAGHTKIAFMHGPEDSRDSAERFWGFQDTLQKHGLELQSDYLARGNFRKQEGYQATLGLLALPDPPTALFAANDQMALGAMDACRDQGLGVPEDFSILGFDDIEAAEYVTPSLTTLRQPTEAMGEAAVRLLFRLMTTNTAGDQAVSLEPKLMIRESVRKILI